MNPEAATRAFVDTERHHPWVTNLLLAAIGLILFAGLNMRSGRVEANDGLGWDGRQYAHMVTGRLQDGTVATQTRPLLPLLTRIPHYAGLDVISAFQVMNFISAAVLYFFLCLLLDLYGVAAAYKLYFVVTLALCIATSKMFAFYPTVIDLGALARSFNPVINTGDSCNDYKAYVDSIDRGAIEVSAVPATGGMQTKVTIRDLVILPNSVDL